MNEDRPLFLLGPIAATLRWLEELANLLSGPLLAVGAIIAVIDLTTDGRLTATYPPILYLFAISQAVGVEMQLTGAWDRARHALAQRRWWGLLGQVLLGLLLGGIVYVGLYAFLGEQSFHMTTTQALTALGVSAHFWLFLRAGIAIFLVALSAWTRYRTPRQTSLQDERARIERELELEPLRQRLRHTRLAGVRDAASALVGGQGGTNTQPSPMEPSDGLPAHAHDGAGEGKPASDATLHRDQPTAASEPVVLPDGTPNTPPDDDPHPPTPRSGRRGKAAVNTASNGHSRRVATLQLVPFSADESADDPHNREGDPPAAKTTRQPRRRAAPAERRKQTQTRRGSALEVAAFKLLNDDPTLTKDALRKALRCKKETADDLYAQWFYSRQQSQRASVGAQKR
ncbi:MAG TPA: hypothetical protein VKQ36_14480 [Ktedonobacterales bacterium]|nr:hypothetical protein [Ktedonobacterales bacterium]